MKKKLILIGLILAMLTAPLLASQQDFDITTSDANTGTTYRAAVNAALQALASNSSGATEPTTPYPYQPWADTSTGYLKLRNAANSAWITLWKLSDASATTADKGLIQIATNSDLITGTDAAKAATSAAIKALLQALGYAINLNAAQINEASASVVAATTSDIATAAGNFVTISNSSGTTNISALGTIQAGAARTTHFSIASGSVVLVHNATSMILPTSANITVADGAVAAWRSMGSGNWRMTGYMKADGTALVSAGVTPNAARVYLSGAQTISTGTNTKVLFDTESYDTGSCFAGNKYTVKAGAGGRYAIASRARYTSGLTAGTQSDVMIYVNGAETSIMRKHTYPDADNGWVAIYDELNLAAGDYVEIYVQQNVTANRDLVSGANGTIMTIHRIE